MPQFVIIYFFYIYREKKFGYLSLLCERKNGINYTSFKDQYTRNQVFDFIDEVTFFIFSALLGYFQMKQHILIYII